MLNAEVVTAVLADLQGKVLSYRISGSSFAPTVCYQKLCHLSPQNRFSLFCTLVSFNICPKNYLKAYFENNDVQKSWLIFKCHS